MTAHDPSLGRSGGLAVLVAWWLKPWLDRTVLFVLSRAAFGQTTRIADLWQAQRTAWWRRAWFTLTIRRLSPWRSLTEAVYQLEGLPLTRSATRVRQIRYRHAWSALMMTQTFLLSEVAVALSVFSLAFWLAPANQVPGLDVMIGGDIPPPIAIVTAWKISSTSSSTPASRATISTPPRCWR